MLRHGETVANAEGYAAGSMDSPLTELGRKQAEEARLIFENFLQERPDLIAHSPLSRAVDTANILNQATKLPTYQCAKLAEQCFGDWRGMSWSDMRSLIGQGQNPPNGESMADFYDRAIAGINEVLALPFSMPLIVTHGGVFDAVWHCYRHDMIDVRNCQLVEFRPNSSRPNFPWDISTFK